MGHEQLSAAVLTLLGPGSADWKGQKQDGAGAEMSCSPGSALAGCL